VTSPPDTEATVNRQKYNSVVIPIAAVVYVMVALVARTGTVWVAGALCLGVLLIAGRLMDAT
jgi:hypothetical protein